MKLFKLRLFSNHSPKQSQSSNKVKPEFCWWEWFHSLQIIVKKDAVVHTPIPTVLFFHLSHFRYASKPDTHSKPELSQQSPSTDFKSSTLPDDVHWLSSREEGQNQPVVLAAEMLLVGQFLQPPVKRATLEEHGASIHRNSLQKSDKLVQRKTECSNNARKGAACLGSPFCLSKLKTLPRIGELLAARGALDVCRVLAGPGMECQQQQMAWISQIS